MDLPIEHWPEKAKDVAKLKAEVAHQDQNLQVVLQGRQVLLCEGNYLNAEIATLLLKDKKMSVDWARDGQEGVAKFRDSLCRIIMMWCSWISACRCWMGTGLQLPSESCIVWMLDGYLDS